MENYTETSGISQEKKTFEYAALTIIAISWMYEGYQTFELGRTSLMGWGYNILFIILWAWRTRFTYTLTLTDEHLEIVMKGLGLHRKTVIPLSQLESFANRYKRSFFRKTKIKKYVHRYSSLDGNPQRILVYRENGRLTGLLFKSSDKVMKLLAERFPDRYLEFPE